MKIRDAIIEDAGEIFKIEQNVFKDYWSLKSIKSEFLNSKHSFISVLEIESNIIGYIFQRIIDNQSHIVNLAIDVSHKLATYKIYSKVVSVPSHELFELQSKSYKNKVLNESKYKISTEAGSLDCWKKFIGENGLCFGIKTFGKSAPYNDVYKYFGLKTESIVNKVKKFIKSKQ